MATKNSTILGRFYLNGSTDTQQRLGFNAKGGTAMVKRLFDPMNMDIYNNFCSFMINRVGYAYTHQQRWENPLKEFMKQKIYYGSTVTETMLNWIKGHSYNVDAQTQFKTYYPEGLQAFHSINHQVNYPISISREQMRQAAGEEYGFNQLVAAVMQQPMNADEYDIYGEMLELFKRMDENYGFARKKLTAAPTTKEACDELLQLIQQMSYDLTVPTTEYTSTDIPVFAQPDEMVLFIRSSVLAATNVQSLAAAYNLEKVDIKYRLKVIPDAKWPLNDGDYAILTTSDFFQCYPIEYLTTSQVDPEGLKTNYWLHDWCIISASPFVPVIVFSTDDSTAVPTVTVAPAKLELTPATGEQIAPGSVIAITPKLTGTVTEGDTTITDGPIKVMPQNVTYDISASRDDGSINLNTRTFIDRRNILHLQKSGLKDGDKITITATSDYLDPEGATTPLTASVDYTVSSSAPVYTMEDVGPQTAK